MYSDETEADIKQDLMTKYKINEVEFFKKDERFIGTIKVTFEDKDSLKISIENRISIFDQRYIVETYKPKPRVVKCNYCQKFGHVIRLCRSSHPICGKCNSKDHETKNCEASPDQHKCVHCYKEHVTEHQDCEVWKEKYENILRRLHDRH